MIKLKKTMLCGLTLIGALILVGCANTTLIPEGGNKFSVVSTSYSEGTANKAAMSKATKTCDDLK